MRATARGHVWAYGRMGLGGRDEVVSAVNLMTGRTDLVTSRKGMEEGADDFLVKPVSLQALLGCVKARLNRASISWRVEDQMLDQLRSSMPSQLPHEFYTPLAGIIGLTEILRADLRSDSPMLNRAQINEIHNGVYQSAIRLHRTLRNYILILDLQTASCPSVPPPLTPREAEEGIGGYSKRRRTGS